MLTNYRDHPGVVDGTRSADRETSFKWVEKSLRAATVDRLPEACRGAEGHNLWMSCAYPVGMGWTQNLVFGPIPASVKKTLIDRRFLRHRISQLSEK
jgi:hypothetical protein